MTDAPPPLAGNDDLEETALQILDAASKRFLHYGYNKTTMSEIARDCNMSTGNLYRYFPSKLDIAEAFVKVLRTNQLASLRSCVDAPGLSAAERVRDFLQRKLTLTYNRFHERPKAYELSTEILRERPQFAVDWAAAEAEVLARILAMGAKEGSFPAGDPLADARLIQHACARYTSPAIFLDGDIEDLSSDLNDLIDLLLDGFAARARSRSA